MKNLDARIFLLAAKIVTESTGNGAFVGACWGISKAKNKFTLGLKEHKFFESNFMPKEKNVSFDFWYGSPTQENQLARQLGLLLCAEVLKDEQRSQKRKSK